MIITWDFDPIAFTIQVHWYGFLFVLGFILGYYFISQVFKKNNIDTSDLELLVIFMFVSTLVGARLAHCLFYAPDVYLRDPISILKIWEGGLASHGGGIGLCLGVYLFAKIKKYNFLPLADLLVIPTAIAGTFIRIGNFLNSEIYGTHTNGNYGVIFTRINDSLPRHPTQLYESLAYLIIGCILFFVYFKSKKHRNGVVLSLFLILIFITRFFIEFVKVEQADFTVSFLTLGQYLSIPFILFGIGFLCYSIKQNKNLPIKD